MTAHVFAEAAGLGKMIRAGLTVLEQAPPSDRPDNPVLTLELRGPAEALAWGADAH